MKGIVFTEFLEMVEKEFGIALLDRIISNAQLPSGGVYTAVGTYDFFEMQALIKNLSQETGIDVQDLIYTYGKYFFQVLLRYHPDIFNLYNSPIEMLASIESHIHVQVRKLYPGAELPRFEIIKQGPGFLKMMYFSERSMYMFAKALMEKTFVYYDTAYQIDFEKINEDGSQVLFTIHKKPHASNPNRNSATCVTT